MGGPGGAGPRPGTPSGAPSPPPVAADEQGANKPTPSPLGGSDGVQTMARGRPARRDQTSSWTPCSTGTSRIRTVGFQGMAGEERMGPTVDGRGKAFANAVPLAAGTRLTLQLLLEGLW